MEKCCTTGCSVCCVGIPLMVINIMMFVAMFQSDKKCGPDLWSFGVVMLVVGMTIMCTRAQVHT